MSELTGISYPWTRLWEQDYSEVLFDSQKNSGTAEEWCAASGRDWVGVSVDHGHGWRTRWGGRMERQEDGAIRVFAHSEYLQHLVVPPSLSV